MGAVYQVKTNSNKASDFMLSTRLLLFLKLFDFSQILTSTNHYKQLIKHNNLLLIPTKSPHIDSGKLSSYDVAQCCSDMLVAQLGEAEAFAKHVSRRQAPKQGCFGQDSEHHGWLMAFGFC